MRGPPVPEGAVWLGGRVGRAVARWLLWWFGQPVQLRTCRQAASDPASGGRGPPAPAQAHAGLWLPGRCRSADRWIGSAGRLVGRFNRSAPERPNGYSLGPAALSGQVFAR